MRAVFQLPTAAVTLKKCIMFTILYVSNSRIVCLCFIFRGSARMTWTVGDSWEGWDPGMSRTAHLTWTLGRGVGWLPQLRESYYHFFSIQALHVRTLASLHHGGLKLVRVHTWYLASLGTRVSRWGKQELFVLLRIGPTMSPPPKASPSSVTIY